MKEHKFSWYICMYKIYEGGMVEITLTLHGCYKKFWFPWHNLHVFEVIGIVFGCVSDNGNRNWDILYKLQVLGVTLNQDTDLKSKDQFPGPKSKKMSFWSVVDNWTVNDEFDIDSLHSWSWSVTTLRNFYFHFHFW